SRSGGSRRRRLDHRRPPGHRRLQHRADVPPSGQRSQRSLEPFLHDFSRRGFVTPAKPENAGTRETAPDEILGLAGSRRSLAVGEAAPQSKIVGALSTGGPGYPAFLL